MKRISKEKAAAVAKEKAAMIRWLNAVDKVLDTPVGYRVWVVNRRKEDKNNAAE